MNLFIKTMRSVGLLLITVSFTVSGMAQSSESSNQSLVDRLTQEMALAEQLQKTPAGVRQLFTQNPMQLPADKNKKMLQTFNEAYSKQKLVDDFKSALQQKITEQYRPALSQWLDKQNVQTVTTALQEFYTLQGKRKRIVSQYEMEQEPPSAQRRDLITTLAEAGSMAESSVEYAVIILRSVITGLGTLSKQRDLSEAQVNSIVNNFRSQMQSQASRRTKDRLMMTYYNVKSQVLENYVQFWQDDAGQWLDKAIDQSKQEAYQAAGDRFLEMINADQ